MQHLRRRGGLCGPAGTGQAGQEGRRFTRQMPFYLCTEHEYLYKKMQKDLELKDYFVETIKEHQ
jgi:hypothetical protein